MFLWMEDYFLYFIKTGENNEHQVDIKKESALRTLSHTTDAKVRKYYLISIKDSGAKTIMSK